MTSSLEALLRPRSVAIVGASDDPSRIGGRPLRYLQEAGFSGPVYPINSKRTLVQGLRSFPTIADVPGEVDVAILSVSAAVTVAAAEACAEKGVKAAIVFSSGFAESGAEGAGYQQRLSAIAEVSGMRIVGPNCLGLFNAHIGFLPTFTTALDRGLPRPGRVAIVSQSGAYGSHLYALARNRGLGIGYWITTGNECDVQVPECLLWAVDNPDVDVVVGYAEGIRQADTLIEAFTLARRLRKPIIFMKVGRSEVGARAASSHTASLAGADAVYDAVFRQYGVHRARSTEELLDVAVACTAGIFPTGNRLGLITISGGVGIQMADAAAEQDLDVAPLPGDAQERLRARLPFAAVGNPVDVTAHVFNRTDLIHDFLTEMLDAGGYDAVIQFYTMVAGEGAVAESLRNTLVAAKRAFPDRLLVLSVVAPQAVAQAYEREGFLVYEDPTRAVAAVAALVRFGRSFAEACAEAEGLAPATAAPLPEDTGGEFGAKRILAAAGIGTVPERLAGTADQAAEAAEILGMPVVLKIASPDILHKTEIGGIVLGLSSADAVRREAEALLTRVREAQPHARIDGVLVAKMIAGGVETILGVHRDPVFGPVVMFGLGGIFVEVLKDVIFRLAPFNEGEALRMIREIRAYPVLEGVRGRPPADIDALATALVRLSAFAAAHKGEIESIDINPFVVLEEGKGALALDAWIERRREGA